jgi:hypothetical protein
MYATVRHDGEGAAGAPAEADPFGAG